MVSLLFVYGYAWICMFTLPRYLSFFPTLGVVAGFDSTLHVFSQKAKHKSKDVYLTDFASLIGILSVTKYSVPIHVLIY